MNSFICFIGYLFAILIMNLSGDVSLGARAVDEDSEVIIGYPYKFNYEVGDRLHMKIILNNLQMYVTEYVILYRGFRIGGNEVHSYGSEEVILDPVVLKYENIWIDVLLWYDYYRLCDTKTIAEGWAVNSSTADQRLTYSDNNCSGACVTVVDFNNGCVEKMDVKFKCFNVSSQFICTLFIKNLVHADTINHQWYQGYSHESYIGYIPPTGIKELFGTKFIINLEYFDNNTVVFYNLKSTTVHDRNLTTNEGVITLHGNESIKHYDVKTKIYSDDSRGVNFSCQEYLNRTNYVQIGLINTITNKIQTFNTANVNKKFRMVDNGSMLCCLLYIISQDRETTVERIVTHKTLLIYDETELSSDKPKGNSEDDSQASINYIIVSAVVIFLLLVIIIAAKKRCWRKTERPQLPIPFDPFYLNLLFRRECEQEIEENEQNHYEEIEENEQNHYEEIT